MKALKLAAAVAALSVAGSALAYESGDVILRVGAAMVDPDASSSVVKLNGIALPGSSVDVNKDTQLGITFTYMLSEHWGLELLAASPFKHTVKGEGFILNSLGLGSIADVKQLPPTLSAQYYFNGADARFQPYVGLGVNYTVFFDEDASDQYVRVFGPSDVELDDSIGLSAQVGMDYQIAENLRLNAAVWYIDIGTDAEITSPLAGAIVKTSVDIDPLVYMVGIAMAF